MFARAALRIMARKVVVPSGARVQLALPLVRSFGGHSEPTVVVPELVDTLEWVLDSPPNVHQFEEPPIVVEIEHLENLVVVEH